MKWRYSLRWKLPHRLCPGPQELASEVVEAGQPAPESVMAPGWQGPGMRCVWISWMRGRSDAGAMSGKLPPADEIWNAA